MATTHTLLVLKKATDWKNAVLLIEKLEYDSLAKYLVDQDLGAQLTNTA